MKTCGMMGEVVGKAASICIKEDTTPRGVYEDHLDDLLKLLQLPGKAHRASVGDEFTIPKDALPLASSTGPMTGINPKSLPGTVIDDTAARKSGKWTAGTGLKGYFAHSYLYAGQGSNAEIEFAYTPQKAGAVEIRYAYLHHENRAPDAVVTVMQGNTVAKKDIDMTKPAPLEHNMISLGTYQLQPGTPARVTISAKSATGNIHADAVQFLPVK